jgi:prepilin signal peptidase PulO-like enzyme (type II secretory pathway)
MTGLDFAAWFVLAFLAVLSIAVVFFIGSLPGRIAKKREHPYAEAISIGGWVTMLAGGILWPLVLIWAYCPDLPRPASHGIEDGV